MVLIDVTLGDLVDRLTILELKAARRPDRFGEHLARLRDALPVHFDVDRLTELRAGIQRYTNDVAGLEREISRLPAQ